MKFKDLSKGKIIIYKTRRGWAGVEVRLEKETVWLSLDQIAGLFNTDKSGISRHIKNIYNSGELSEHSTVVKIATVQKEGNRQIQKIRK